MYYYICTISFKHKTYITYKLLSALTKVRAQLLKMLSALTNVREQLLKMLSAQVELRTHCTQTYIIPPSYNFWPNLRAICTFWLSGTKKTFNIIKSPFCQLRCGVSPLIKPLHLHPQTKKWSSYVYTSTIPEHTASAIYWTWSNIKVYSYDKLKRNKH